MSDYEISADLFRTEGEAGYCLDPSNPVSIDSAEVKRQNIIYVQSSTKDSVYSKEYMGVGARVYTNEGEPLGVVIAEAVKVLVNIYEYELMTEHWPENEKGWLQKDIRDMNETEFISSITSGCEINADLMETMAVLFKYGLERAVEFEMRKHPEIYVD